VLNPVHGVGDVVSRVEEAGDLVDAVDEHEAAHLRKLRTDGMDEVQGETGEGGNRARDIGDHHDLGLGRPWVAELRIDRDPTGRQRMAHRRTEIQGSLASVPALAGQAHRQLAGERMNGPAQRRQFLTGWRA